MASDLDLLLTATLEDRAGGDIDPSALTRAAIARGRRIRCRRAVAGGTALVAVVVLGTALLVLPASLRRAEPAPIQAGVTLTGRAPMLPPSDQAGAAVRPDLVGVDPRVLHFSVDAFTGTATEVTWTVREKYERAEVRGPGFEATIEVSPSENASYGTGRVVREAPAAARVAGLMATVSLSSTGHAGGLPLWSIRWQPTAGLWARVDVRTQIRRDAERLANLVRFDVAQRCVLPFAMVPLPAGMTAVACSVSMSLEQGARFTEGTLTWQSADNRTFNVRATATSGVEAFGDGLRAGPHRVHVDGEAYFLVAPPYWVDTMSDATPGGRAEILQLLSGLRTRGTATDPMSW